MNVVSKAVLLSLALPVMGSAAEKVVFKETFDTPESLKKWTITNVANSGKFAVENGALCVTHEHNPGNGNYMEIRIPKIKRGRVDFDVMIDPERYNPAARIGLTFEIYNIATFWHDSCRDWRLYFPEPNYKRMPEFDIEPVGHQRITVVPKHKYVHYSIFFDEEKDMVEFYSGDMRDPKAARYDVSVYGHGFYRGGFLRIGNFGFTDGPYRTLVDNVVVTEMSEETAAQPKTEFLLFDGIASDIVKFNEAMKPLKVRRYVWDSTGANIVAHINNCEFVGMPGFQSVEKAQLIVFNDTVNIEPALQRKIMESVKNGTDVLFQGGHFTFNKGGYKNSPFEMILPIKMKDSLWGVSGDKAKALSLSTAGSFKWDNAKDSKIYYYWDMEPADGSEVLLTASESGWFGKKDIPILVRKKFGKGYVYVFIGTPCGPSTETSFWNKDYVSAILKFIKESRSAK